MHQRHLPVRTFVASLVVLANLFGCGGGGDGPVSTELNVGGAARGGTSNGTGGAVGQGGTKASSTSQGGAIGGTASSTVAPGQGGNSATSQTGAAGKVSDALGGNASGGASLATGGKATGGAATSTATGGNATGGKSTGGAATGGAATGGKSVGGAATGGAATGGKATGGAATGGAATGGKATGGAATGGAATGGAAPVSSLSCDTALPAYTTSTTVSSTITITGTKDYAMQRFCADPNTLGPGDQSESQKAVFMLAKGAVLKNVIIGGSNCSAADGVHCESGSCTLENVWIGDVGEDAISFKGSDSSQVMTINGGGAFEASDKVIQHNGPGTIKINGFLVKNAGKLYRSCGNCGSQYARHVELTNVFASGIKSVVVGINANYGDTATINSLTQCGTVKGICETFTGNDTGDEPTALKTYTTSGDGTSCIFTAANIK